MTIDRSTDVSLSPEGRARRAAMLGELTATMRRVHHRRRLGSASASLALLVLVFASGWHLNRQLVRIEDGTSVAGTDPQPVEIRTLRLVSTVHTDATASERLAARPSTRAVRIDDDTLLDQLAALERRAGLVRAGGKVWLTADVTDPF
jgi:hypothetical protein